MSVVEESLREIDAVALDVLDVATRAQAKRKAGGRRDAYKKALRETRDIAGGDGARDLADWIQNRIRTQSAFPSARSVRKQGADICRSRGYAVPSDSWLGV